LPFDTKGMKLHFTFGILNVPHHENNVNQGLGYKLLLSLNLLHIVRATLDSNIKIMGLITANAVYIYELSTHIKINI
jgi:hypothetical protein